MSNDKSSLDKAIEQIKKAGFSHIKVELEADLGRDGERYCNNCVDGSVECYECGGDGFVMASRPNGSETEVECDECYGDGQLHCDDCDGSGYCGGYYDEDYCDDYIQQAVPSEVRSRLTYGEFYEDGSVDSEFTFTVPIEHARDIVEWINAFKSLGSEIGNGIETGGAGMHISVIPDYAKGNYPVREQMPEENIVNFREQMTTLLPALYFLASPNSTSRELGYRQPRVDDDEKYSAIYTHGDTCIEYRLFETTYDNPEDIFTQIEVIAKTLQFYADPDKKVQRIGDYFGISDAWGHNLKRFYDTPEKVAILRKQLVYLKPEGKTQAQLFRERGVVGITELRKEHSRKRAEARRKYYRALQVQKELMKQPLTPDQQRYLEEEVQLRMNSQRTISAQQRRALELEIRGVRQMPTLREYIMEQVSGYNRENWRIAV